MRTAVDAVFVGKARQFDRRFLQLCSGYLVEPMARTPRSGWEKGQIGTSRERLFTPRLRFPGYPELNGWLKARCLSLTRESGRRKTGRSARCSRMSDRRRSRIAARRQLP